MRVSLSCCCGATIEAVLSGYCGSNLDDCPYDSAPGEVPASSTDGGAQQPVRARVMGAEQEPQGKDTP